MALARAAALLVAALTLAVSAQGGAYPGGNGKVAFMSDRAGNFDI